MGNAVPVGGSFRTIMPYIQSISVAAVHVPLDRVTSFATRTVTAREYCLVKVRSSDQQEGIGFCYAGTAGANLIRLAIEVLLSPLLIGQECARTEGLWEEMYRETIIQGRTGAIMRAISTIDIALWDLNARSVQLPLYRYLGCQSTKKVPAYASGGYYLEGKTPEKLGQEVSSYVQRGFRAVKIKVGRLGAEEEEERVRAAREAIGPEVYLMLDVNNAWADLPTALAYCRRFEKYDPYWIEEPFSPDDIENHSKLASCIETTVATGEIEAGRWRFKELMEKHAAEILQADAAVCGGISEWRRIAQTAASFGVTLSPHWFHDLHVHLVAATPNARFVEFFPDDQVLNFRKLLDRQLQVDQGALLLPQGPGLGFEFDEKAVATYAVEPNRVWTEIKGSQ
jgi:L-alanine-DL-glutamate epimerase-like enolase superfamily enzyme